MTTSSSLSPGAKAQLQTYLRSVEGLLRSGDMPNAMRLSHEAVAKGCEHAHLLTLASYHQLNSGALQQALDLAVRARALAPRNIDVLNAVGNCLTRLQRHRESVEAFDAVLRLAPDAYLTRYNKARSLEELQELTRARVEYERIVDTHPQHAETLARLAYLAWQRGDTKAARDLSGRALQIDPGQSGALITLAAVEVEEEHFEIALRHIEAFTRRADGSVTNLSIAQGLRGDALDGLDRPAEAFRAYTASQVTRRAALKAEFEKPGTESARAVAARLTTYFRDAPQDRWRVPEHAAEPGQAHVFLVGFPRSGTTLLEQILASHPDIDAMGERSCLVDSQDAFTIPPDGLDRLADLSADELEPYRNAYWARVAQEGSTPRRRVFVDKMPLYSVFLCLVAKLFPRAKILFAVRDPRDVVLSCFRRRFVMTQQMYELMSLESAADYYDGVMQLSGIYRGILGLEFCDLRHEDMIADLEGETRRLCDFLRVEWNAAMEDFARTAGSRSVNTPSGPQLARGLSSQGVGQWRRYRKELAPVLPKLAPWVAHFGYAEE
jgi:Tfp pilus assembly protein PilF